MCGEYFFSHGCSQLTKTLTYGNICEGQLPDRTDFFKSIPWPIVKKCHFVALALVIRSITACPVNVSKYGKIQRVWVCVS